MKSTVAVVTALVVLSVGAALYEGHIVNRQSIDRDRLQRLALAQQAQIQDLQTEMAHLKQPSAAAHSAAAEKAGDERRSGTGAGHTALAAGLTPVTRLSNAGRATARDAFATQLWASRNGNIDLAAATLAFTPEGRAILQRAEAKLPADLAAQYATPEKLMAYALAGSPHPVGGMEVTGESPQDDGTVILHTRWQHEDDDIVHQSDLVFEQDSGGWKQVVPNILVRRAAGYLTNGQ